MTKKQLEDYRETLNTFEKESSFTPNEMYDALDTIHRAETTLHRIAENHCNGHPKRRVEYRDGKQFVYDVEDLDWLARDEKTEARLEAKIKGITKQLGFKVDFNGDPRGGTIRFTLPSGKSNNWDGETWGVYW